MFGSCHAASLIGPLCSLRESDRSSGLRYRCVAFVLGMNGREGAGGSMADGDMEEPGRGVMRCVPKGFTDGAFALCGRKCVKYCKVAQRSPCF